MSRYPSALDLTAPVTTSRLRLRRFAERDLQRLTELLTHPHVAAFLPASPSDPYRCRIALRERRASFRLAGPGDLLAVAVTEAAPYGADQLLGELSLWWHPRLSDAAELGFAFHPRAQGAGRATEAAAALINRAVHVLPLQRILARTRPENRAAAALLFRLGMRQISAGPDEAGALCFELPDVRML